MPKVFISYRRADSQTITDRIYDRLAAVFGEENVFQDVDSIRAGADFRVVLKDAVEFCDVVLVIIGSKWARVTDDLGQKRLMNPADFVRIELESALNSQKVVIPALIEGAMMPDADDLPPSLHELLFRNAVKIRHNPDFKRDIQRLIEQIQAIDADKQTSSTPYVSNASWRRWRKPAIGLVITVLVSVGIVAAILSRQQTPNRVTPTAAPTNIPLAAVSAATLQAIVQPTQIPTVMMPIVVSRNVDWKPVERDVNGVMMVQVPEGCFDMGNDPQAFDGPIQGVGNGGHICFISAFWIDKTEVTNAQFTQFGGKQHSQAIGRIPTTHAKRLRGLKHATSALRAAGVYLRRRSGNIQLADQIIWHIRGAIHL